MLNQKSDEHESIQYQNAACFQHLHPSFHFILTNKTHKHILPPDTQPVDKCLLSNNILDYHIVSQGKTTIPSVDDKEEMGFTDVRTRQ
jgi:hypothetical protein